jgi:hypothetical protein
MSSRSSPRFAAAITWHRHIDRDLAVVPA